MRSNAATPVPKVRRPLWALSSYLPGHSLVHRLPAGVKLAGVFVTTVILAVTRGWIISAAILVVSIIVALCAQIPVRLIAAQVLRTAGYLSVLGALVVWRSGFFFALEMVLDLTAAIMLAWIATLTTRTDHIFDAVYRMLRPIDRSGRLSDRLALSFAMVMRTVPALVEVTSDTRAAAAARGMSKDPKALLTPMAIRTVAHAHLVGEALAARGLLEGQTGSDSRDQTRP